MTHAPFIKFRVLTTWAMLFGTIALIVCASSAWAADSRRLVSDSHARHLGLERAWYAQVRLDPARNEVERAVLNGDRLTVLTTAGVVQEFDALTGRTYWFAPVGNPDHP